jgi:hypothetical protein
MTFFAMMIEIEPVELAAAGVSLIAMQLTVCHKESPLTSC